LVPESGFTLSVAVYINDPGEIAAFAIDSSGNNHDVLLIPCDENHPNVDGCDYSMVEASTVPPPHSVTPEASWGIPSQLFRLHGNRPWFPKPDGSH
jgi:hypothetical protein